MSNIEILEKGVEYTVLHRTVDTPQPYIVAWKFHPQTMDWEQGALFRGSGIRVQVVCGERSLQLHPLR